MLLTSAAYLTAPEATAVRTHKLILPEVLSFLYIEIKNISNVNRHMENGYLCHFV